MLSCWKVDIRFSRSFFFFFFAKLDCEHLKDRIEPQVRIGFYALQCEHVFISKKRIRPEKGRRGEVSSPRGHNGCVLEPQITALNASPVSRQILDSKTRYMVCGSLYKNEAKNLTH